MNVTPLRSPSIQPAGAEHRAGPEGGAVNALGTVASALPGGLYSVESDGRVLHCQRAASCLLRPEVGDLVLVSGPDSKRLYLTAVAEQADARISRLDVSGDVTLASERGAINIESATQLSLQGREGLRMDAPQLQIDADTADCRVGRLAYSGEEAEARVLSVRVIGRVYEAIVERLVHLSKTAFRMTEGIDQVRASHIDYKATEMARLHGKNTVVTAQDLIKADASQIHMG